MLAWLAACHGGDGGEPPATALDLAEPLGAGEVRAGVLRDEAGTFGGIDAEARPGDVKIYNDRVRFVIQGVRSGDWYLPEGGGVIDADVVRPDGVPGRDAVEEWDAMFGLGRILVPEKVEVVSDGSDGKAAVVRVTGYEGALGLMEGALEAPGIVPELGLELTTEYRLEPDSWLLEVTSTATATDVPAPIAIGDLLIGADEVLDPWTPGIGLAPDPGIEPRAWSGYVADRNDVAYLIAAPPGEQLSVSGYSLLTALAAMVLGFSEDVTVAPGDSFTWTRWWGVGPDLATLSDAVLQARGEPTQEVSGTVTAPDGPVPGARVVVDVDGAPYTVAVTGADGSFSTQVPQGAATTLAVGRGEARFTDLPDGAPPMSPYVGPELEAEQLDELRQGAPPLPMAEGRGVGSPSDPLVLGEPGWLVITADDGLPFTARLGFLAPDAPTDVARVPARPDGLEAAGWSKDGEIRMPVEAGSYDLVVHRGPRYEAFEEPVTVTAGQETRVQVSLPEAFAHDGWLLGDPHVHASPSPDASITMEDRLVVGAAVGIQVHFGTDHDNLADYRPLLAPLGLEGVEKSIVSDEVSPPLRGHFNIYPVEPDPSVPNNGAWAWWVEIPTSTTALHDELRSKHGPDFVLQSNHPLDMGMGSSASWSPGRVLKGDFWSDRIQAVEVLNSGQDQDRYLPFWADLVERGYKVTPTGTSDSHDHFGGSYGLSTTWIHAGTDQVTDATDEAIGAAIRDGRVEPSLGVFLALDHDPGEDVAPGATITVEARSASWVKVDRLRLFRDGAEVEVQEGTTATFTLSPDADAIYWITAEGDTPMHPVSDRTPWAMAGPWRVDVDGNGWTPPLPPLEIDE